MGTVLLVCETGDGSAVHFNIQGTERTMRQMEFKMERPGIIEEGERVSVTEGVLPSSWYYTIDPSRAMSANFELRERLKTREGEVIRIEERPQGYYVTVQFDE